MGRFLCGLSWHGPSWFWAELSSNNNTRPCRLESIDQYPQRRDCVKVSRTTILEAWVLTHLSTILSLMKYTCKDRLSCTVYVTNEHIVHQFLLLIIFCIDQTLENFKRKQTPAVHNIFLRVI